MLQWLSSILALYWPIFKIIYFYLLLGSELGLQFIAYAVGLLPSRLIKHLIDKNNSEFWKNFGIGVGLLAINATVAALVVYFEKRMYIRFRYELTRKLLNRYFQKNNFYKLNNSSLDNVDQRISMDIERFSSTSSQVIKVLVITPFTLSWYIYKCWIVTSWWGPLACFIFFLIGSLVNNLTLPRVVRESQLVESREGDYRWQNARIRRHAENIALSKGANFEHQKTLQIGEKLFDQQIKLENTSFLLNATVNIFDYFGGVLPYFCLAPLVFGGIYDHLDPSELSALISENSFVIIYLVFQFTKLFDQIRSFGDVLATGKRVVEIGAEIKKETQDFNSESIVNGSDLIVNESCRDDDVINLDQIVCVSGLTNSKPRKLFEKMSFELGNGQSMIIEGENGTGKTSLSRLLAGLWHADQGTIKLPRNVMFLQETPVLTDGTLMEQIIYPDHVPLRSTSRDSLISRDLNMKENSCKEVLRSVGLDYLILDLHRPARWETILSCGEKQKLAFARIFIQRPKLVFLDESSSSLSLKSERELYSELKRLDIQFISVSHRHSNIESFHEIKLTLKADCLYSISNLESTTDAN